MRAGLPRSDHTATIQVLMPAETLRINEIFHSIQGESTWSGCPCVFVRLTGCHLRCTYCDTAYAFNEGDHRPIDAVVADICAYPCNLIEVTGGEPLLQPGVHALIRRLCDLGKTVLIETSGACDISRCDPRAIRIVDIKTPGSSEADRNIWKNIEHLTGQDEIKFVITDRADFDWAVEVIRRHNLTDRVKAILFSAVFGQAADPGCGIQGCDALSPRDLAEWLLVERFDGSKVRMQAQLHKLIWDPMTRGV